MKSPFQKGRPTGESPASGQAMRRLQFELALDVGVGGRQPADSVKEAAGAAGVDLLLVLPVPSGNGVSAVVRLKDDDKSSFLQVISSGQGFTVLEEPQMDAALLSLARASVDVFERMSADAAIRRRLAAG